MSGQRRRLLGLTLLTSALALFDSSVQGSRSASPPEIIEFDQAVVRHVWPKGLSVAFEGKAGEVITLQVLSKTSGLDPRVSLLDPEDIEEAFDDDSGGRGNCLIKDHALKKDGKYRVFIEGEDRKEGEVEILISSPAREQP